MGVADCKKAPYFQMDSQICIRFNGKVGHEQKDSRLTVRAYWQKGGVTVACNKKTLLNGFMKHGQTLQKHMNTHTNTFIGHDLTHLYILTLPPCITQLFVTDSCGRHHSRK